MSEPQKTTAQNSVNQLYCAACGLELDPQEEQSVLMGEHRFCIWCWSNDCCRVSRDAAQDLPEKEDYL